MIYTGGETRQQIEGRIRSLDSSHTGQVSVKKAKAAAKQHNFLSNSLKTKLINCVFFFLFCIILIVLPC